MVKLATKLEPSRAQLQLKVTLQGIKPAIWRRLLVSAKIKLPKFDAVLQHAFDWTNSHLHAFRIGDQSYEAYDPELWDDWPGGPEKLDEGEFRLGDPVDDNYVPKQRQLETSNEEGCCLT